MNRAFPRAASACTLALGLSLSGLAWADTATLPPGPLIDINGTANSLGTATDAATTKSNSLTGNTVTLTSGAVDGYVVGAINQEDGDAATGNHVNINGGTVGLNAYGGWAIGDSASNNTVSITAGSVTGDVFGGYNYTVTSGNSVAISGGTVGGSVYGGFGTAITGNSVTISGGTISGSVYGAAAPNATAAGTPPSNNTLTISGTPVFDPANTFLGGWGRIISCPPPGPCAIMMPMDATNNNLNLHSAGLTVAGVLGINNLNFYLPASLSTGTPVLTVTGTADFSAPTLSGPTNAKITVQTDSTSPATLHDGDTYTLIQAGTLNLPAPFTPVTGTITDATHTAFSYTVDVDATGNNLVLKIGTAPPVPPSASAAAVPATGPAALALLALLLAATGWLTRRGARR